MLNPEPGNTVQGESEPSPEAVREELERTLASAEFGASDRLKGFLRYVVEETLAGRADLLKGYTIAVEVFGRDPAFDPQNDPVVRMEAGKLRRRLDLYYLDAGRADPIRIEIPKGSYVPTFSWQRPGAAAEAAVADPSPLSRRRWSRQGLWGLGALALAGLLALSTTIWLRSEAPTRQAAVERPAPQERGPAIIVLPFENLSEPDTGEVFASGLTEELISNLMRFGELRLYSSFASFQEKPSADPVELNKRLDVGYVIKGGARRDADQVRLIVHLIGARTGQVLWSQTYDRPLTPENVFAVQEQLAADLASQLAQPYGIINGVSADAFRQQRPETLFAYDCVLRALDYRRTQAREKHAVALACLEEAVRRDPGYADAWAFLAYMYLDQYRFGGYGPRSYDPAFLERATTTARHAVELDPDGVYPLLALSTVHFYRREFAEAAEINRRLLALSPTNPEVLGQIGWRTAYAGHWDEGVALTRRAIDRSIRAPWAYPMFIAFDHYRRGEYQAALADVEPIAQTQMVQLAVFLAALHGELGNKDEARRQLDRAMAINPLFLADPGAAMRRHNTPEDLINQIIDGLIKAGWAAPASPADLTPPGRAPG
jgi:TolB-like protein